MSKYLDNHQATKLRVCTLEVFSAGKGLFTQKACERPELVLKPTSCQITQPTISISICGTFSKLSRKRSK